ncbi:hypothetical protein KI688_005887 [Linnemannia hyalina]|uniref:Uncharacterized protein n=1 Tax=Linnemannia hyalina TaxID=64524 RepID=A0A9P7Y1Q6_9FUNG|nr:hypothetical protein KI688_005887 [Linnemannia hyalina]
MLPAVEVLRDEVIKRVRAFAAQPQRVDAAKIKTSREIELEAEIQEMRRRLEEVSVSAARRAQANHCTVLDRDMVAGLVKLDFAKCVIYPETQGCVETNYGRGGMKALVDAYYSRKAQSEATTQVMQVTVEEDVVLALFKSVEPAEEIGKQKEMFILMTKRKLFEGLENHNEGFVLKKGSDKVEVVDASTSTEKKEKRFTVTVS